MTTKLTTKIEIRIIKTQINAVIKSVRVRSDLSSSRVSSFFNCSTTNLCQDLLCLDNTYLYFRGKFCRQIFDLTMGSPISIIIANLVMENVEEGAMSTFFNPPKFRRRYVDDTLVVIKKQKLMNFIII